MLALFENVGVLWKCWHFIKMLALYENVGFLRNAGALRKCGCPTKMSAHYTNFGDLHNELCKKQHLCKMTVFLLFGLAKLHNDYFSSALPGGFLSLFS
jgi:hypothetical protein